MSKRTKIFISYSHANAEDGWLQRLHIHLRPLERDGILDRWDDTRLKPGSDWRQEIAAALAEARVAVLLVSADFIASDFIAQEELPVLLARAEREGARIIPILGSPCKLPESLATLQFVNPLDRPLIKMTKGEQEQVWTKVAEAVEEALKSSGSLPPRRVLASCCLDDRPAAERVIAALAARGLSLELSVWDPNKVSGAVAALIDELAENQSALLVIGAHGLGPWASGTARDALESMVRARRLVCPVLLPGISDFPDQMPVFLARNTWIPIVRGLDDEPTLDRIYMGLTGAKPNRRPPPIPLHPPTPPQDPIDKAIKMLVPLLGRNLTVLLGTKSYQNGAEFPPRPCELARNLLVSLAMIEPSYDQLLPPLDFIGSYYAARDGESNLEVAVNQIMGSRKTSPAVHEGLVELLRLLEERYPDHGRLIVTSSFDLLLERALLRAGVRFTRVVQHWSGDRLEINEYQEVKVRDGMVQISHRDYQTREVSPGDTEALDRVITEFGRRPLKRSKDPSYALPGNEFKGLILYKFHGSRDIENSCAITADQYHQLSRISVPDRITSHTASGPVLVLGHGILDTDFRLTFNMLLRGQMNDRRYAVLLPPDLESYDDYRRIEVNLWPDIKQWALSELKTEVLEGSCDEFLERLIGRLQ